MLKTFTTGFLYIFKILYADLKSTNVHSMVFISRLFLLDQVLLGTVLVNSL